MKKEVALEMSREERKNMNINRSSREKVFFGAFWGDRLMLYGI